tara:strand:- start:207 stop:485 length:279 start_codon:yes stop_codon:yes gene_type:complete
MFLFMPQGGFDTTIMLEQHDGGCGGDLGTRSHVLLIRRGPILRWAREQKIDIVVKKYDAAADDAARLEAVRRRLNFFISNELLNTSLIKWIF